MRIENIRPFGKRTKYITRREGVGMHYKFAMSFRKIEVQHSDLIYNIPESISGEYFLLY